LLASRREASLRRLLASRREASLRYTKDTTLYIYIYIKEVSRRLTTRERAARLRRASFLFILTVGYRLEKLFSYYFLKSNRKEFFLPKKPPASTCLRARAQKHFLSKFILVSMCTKYIWTHKINLIRSWGP
jgi:hypothetical protein